MQNDPLQGNANPNSINHPAHLAAAEEAERYTGKKENEAENEEVDNNKEHETKPEDFESFNVDKVDDLNKIKQEDVDHK
ncbi:hypothetical protein [Marinilactibacillus sp. Marseille-P9653]|uniref:hypothetical protein n=1 Tax=Marinilactibacillus sp. Marseille-P9653 TaxID=2866583 RepID=UPI001CE4043D|nr:hypothetical protein [Marinilactibacillus sp. Marseille-P9653]